MLSNRGERVAFKDRLGDFKVRDYLCLECGKKITMNLHWDHRLNRIPRVCPNCKKF